MTLYFQNHFNQQPISVAFQWVKSPTKLHDFRRIFTFLEKKNLVFLFFGFLIKIKKRKMAANKSVVKSTGQTFARLCCLLQSAVLPLILQPRSWSDVHFHTGQRVYVQHMLSLLHCKHALAVAKSDRVKQICQNTSCRKIYI